MNLTESNKQSLAILSAAFLILANTLLHAHVYGNRNYRGDEVFIVRLSSLYSLSTLVVESANDTEPFAWRLLIDFWLDLFGTAEAVARWSSKLLNLLSFALIFQLGKHLIDRRAALYAVGLLGLYGFASNGMYEMRPYAMLVALVTALHLIFLRWLVKPTGRLLAAYVCLGIVAIYTHFYAFTIFAAHAPFMLFFRRLDRQFVYKTVGLWIFIALSFLPWILPLMQTILGSFPGGYYSLSLPALIQAISFDPAIIFQFLLIASLIALLSTQIQSESRSALRWYPLSRLVYPLFLLLATFAFALIVNPVWSVLAAQGFTTVVMLIALMMALGLWLLPTKVGTVLLILLYLHAPANIAFQPTNAPYREFVGAMDASYQNDSVVVTEFSWAWRWLIGSAYYLMEFTPDKMTKDRIFHLVEPGDSAHPPVYPDELKNIFKTFSADAFGNQLPAHKQLWRLSQGGGNDLGDAFADWLNQNYALIRTHEWDEPYLTSYALSEYVKAPDHQGPMVLVGDELRLYAWERHDSVEVEACQSVTIESWWQLDAEVDQNYSFSLILADSDGDGQLAIQNSIPAKVFTNLWESKRFYRDQSTLEIPCNIKDGRYNLLLAAKETVSGTSLPLRYPDGNDIGNEYYLTTLTVSTS